MYAMTRIKFFLPFVLLFMLVAVLFVSTQAQAQSSTWGACTNGLCYTGGNVGVSTLSPITKLDVNGHVKSVANTGGATFVSTPSAGGQSYGMTAVNGTFYLGKTNGPGQGVSNHFRIYSNGDMCLGSTCN